MAQNIEIPVSLGLQDAQAKAAELRKILQASVNVKSDTFRDIQRLLDKITSQADGLKGKMAESFKTPSGSKSFLKQYEQLFSLIDVAKEKMTSLKLEDISFSGTDLDQVKNYKNELQTLQQEIEALSKGKIGNIFEGDTIANAEKVREAISNLRLDPSKLTFSALSAAIGKELDNVNDLLAKSQSKLDQYKSSIQALNGSNYNNLQQKMQDAISGAIDPSKSTFKTENLVKYSEAIEEFYNNFGKLKVEKAQQGEIAGGGNVSKFIDQEGNAIQVAAEKMKEQIKSYEDALQKLQELKDAPIKKGVVKKDEAKKIADELGLTFDANEKTETAITNLQERIRQAWNNTGFQDSKEINEYADQMLKALGESFDKADLNQYINPKQLSNQLKNVFSQAGLDLKDTNISAIFNSISANMDVGKFFQEAIQHMENYRAAKEQLVQSEQTNNDALKTSQQDLEAANQAATDGQTSSNSALDQKRDKVEQVIEALQRMVDAINGSNNAQINPDDSGLRNGQTAINAYIDSLTKLQQKQKSLSNIQSAVNRWMGFWQVLNMTKSAINDMKQHIQELDSVMTSIAVVTNFSQDDLWGQISQYSEIARQYGVAIKGVYEVSQIYYQQGLQQNDVMTLTAETLKMARIAGLDYATAADYMTTAIRGFKLEMQDAAHVTDVFSALAATTASSTEEIAVAISKTAASAEAVGASFEATSAMMATMIATTRESATNIGTALKSVISRYGEMTSDPSKTVDSEGEEMSLNRVDKALQTVGITIHDTAGQFRDFDDVMLELMEKWDSLDSLSQRYIATLMAGNRQQSRFLALVSNVDEYKKALETAMNSEGTGELQTLKTLDSIDAKIEKMKVTIQEFYTSSGIEELYKGILDSITNIVSAANSLPKALEKIPVAAVAMGASIISAVKSAIQVILGEIQAGLEMMKGNTQSTMTGLISMMAQGGRQSGEAYRKEQEAAMNGSTAGKHSLSKGAVIGGMMLRYAGAALSIAGASQTLQGMNAYGASLTHDEDQIAANQVRTGGILGIFGSAASGAAMGTTFGPYGAVIGGAIGGIKGLIENIATLTSANEMYNVSVAREIELSSKRLEAAKQDQLEAKNTEKQLEQAYTKLKELEEHQYDSVEAQQEYHDYMNQLADSYPAYVEKIDQANNAIIYSGTLEEELAKARELTASATTAAIEAELNKADWQETSINNFRNGLQGLYSEGLTTNDSNLVGLAQVVRKAAGTDINQPTNLNYRALFEEETMTEEQAAEYLVKSYLSRYSDIELDHYNRRTGQTDLSQFGTRYTYKGLLNQTVGRSDKSLLELIMTDSNLGAERDAIRYSRGRFEELLIDFTKEAEKAGQTVSLETITKNKNIKNVNDIYNLTDKEFQAAVAEAKIWANQTATATEATKQGIETALISAKTREKVTTQINTLENKQDKVLAEQYENLIAYGLSAKFGQDIDKIDSKQFNEAFTNLSDWIKNNQESAEALANIDYSQYISFKELEDSIKNFGDLDDKIEDQIKADFNEARTNAVTLYTNQLNGIFDDEEAPNWLTDTDQFTNKTLTAIQSDLKQYQSLIEKQQYAQAEAYLNSMREIYGENGIGGLTGEQQTEAYSVIKGLDLSDPEALRSAAKTFAEMGPEFKGLSDQFTNAALRWATSAATLLEQLSSSTQETAKSIESSTSDMSKVFKYSEALEKAQALMDANEGVKFDELFTFDKDLGGYVKTAKAFQLEMAELQNQQIEGISLAITDITETLSSVFDDKDFISLANSDRTIETGQAKEKFAELTHTKEGDVNFDRLWLEYTQIIEAFRNQDKDWNTFITEYVNEHGTQLQLQLDEINNMSSQMASLQLESFDYTSIVSGKGTTQSKETLKALLLTVVDKDKSYGIDKFFDHYYTQLITGNIQEFNKFLEAYGLSDFQVSEGQANRARFESLKSLYNTLLDENPVWEALDDTQKKLLESVGINKEKYNTEGVSSAVTAVWTALTGLTDGVIANLDELRSEIAKNADNNFKKSNAGKQKDLLDKYKDGFTSDELVELQGNTDLLLTKEGNLTDFAAQYFERDANTGDFIIKAGQDAASVLQYLAQKLGIAINTTTDQYKDTIQTSINEEIARLDKADIDKQRASQISALSNAKVGDRLNVSLLSSATQKRLTEAGLDITSGILTVTSEEALNNGILALKDKLTQGHWAERHPAEAREIESIVSTFEGRMNKITGLSGIISESVTKDAAKSFALAFEGTTEKASEIMERMGAVWDNLSQSWIIDNEDLDSIEAYIDALEEADDGTNAATITQMRTSLANLRDTFAYDGDRALIDLIENYSNVSNEAIAKFNQYYGEQLQTAGKSIDEFIITDEFGNKTLKVVELQEALTEAGNNVDDLFKNAVASYADTYLESIEKVQGYVKSGTTSRAEMETFAKQFEEITGNAVDIDKAFEYDSEIKAWKLDNDYLIRYAYARGQQLGMIDDEYKKYVNDLLKEDVTSSIQEVLSNINNQNRRQELDDALFNYYRNLFQSDPSKIEGGRQAVSDLAQTTTERWKELQARGGGIIASVEGLAGGLVDHTIAQLQETAKAEESTEEQIIQMAKAKALETREIILKGGEKAVDAYKEINENATAEELEQIYNFAANPLRQAYDDLGKKAGETVSGLAAEIMKVSEGFEIQELADGTAVITAVGDMVQAYGNLYKRMEGVAGVTTSDLNNVYASLLTANDQKEIDAIELLSSAEGMTYQALGEMLSKYGHKLEDWVNKPGEHGIELLGAGKVRIDDWDKVATSLGLEGGTQEYIDAYKAYNDEQIEYQNKIKDSIKSEIDTLKNAKSGDFINLTQIWKSYGEAFEVALTKAGISEQFKKGILEIKSSADIPKLLQEIGDIAAASQDLIPSELAELSDAIASFLEGLTDLISQGISGGLSYVDKNNLIEQARSQLGVNDLEFVQTADGFQLVETSALKLYDALKKVNSFAAGKLFEGLREQLEKVNENFESSSALTAYISSTRQDILNTDNKVSNARKEQYKEELDIAKEILAVRATSEDDSFNFMNQDIPAGQNNPLNYMASWKTAFDSIKQAKRTGHMDYKDFYNFVTEVGHLAEITGKAIPLGKKSVENSQEAADLITQAASQLKTVEQDGSYKINLNGLKQIGIDFAAGAQGMSDGIDEGIHQMAQSQIDMLDGLISLLETIVQMEKLSDIDIKGDGIDIGDILKINYDGTAEYTPIYDEWREDMRQKFQDYLDSKDPKTGKATVNVDLGRFIEGATFKAGGDWVNFSDMLNMPASELAKKSTEFQTAYAALIKSLVQASLSGNYDRDSIMQSVSQVLAESGVTDLELDLGNMHLSLVGGKISTVTYNKEEYEKLIKSGKTQRQISEAVSKFNHGEGLKDTSFTITDILKLVHNIAYKVENGKTYITSPDGSEQVEIPANGDLSNRAKQMANAWALKEQGLDTSKINYTDNGDAVEVTTTIGLKPGIKVRASGDGEITWNPDDDTIDIDGTKVTPTGNNQEEYLQSIIDQYRKKTGQGEKVITDEEILWKSELKIRAQLSSSLVDKNGKALNTSGDPKLVQEISDKAKEVRQMTDDQLQKAFQPDKSGNYTIDIGGKQYTIRAEDITVDGKIDAEKAANTLFSASGLDAALQANISSAIVSGFESLSTTLEGLNAEPATNVANAIQSIGTNADTTAGKVEKLVETLGKLGNFGSSEKPSNKDNKSVDEKLAVKEAEVSVPEVTSDFKDTEITIPDGTEVTAKDGSRVIIDNDIMAEPHSLNPFDMTYLPTDFGNQQVKAGSMMRIDNPIKAIVKEIELDLTEAKPKIQGPVNKDIEKIGKELQTSEKNISDSSSSAAESVPKAFSSPMQQAVDIVGQAVASILSHITTMTAQSTDAFTSVKEEVGSIQQHVPITWTIGINFDNPIFDAWFSGRGFEGLGSNAEHLTEEMTVNANTKGAEETANKAADYISTLSPDITVNAVDGGVAGQVAEILAKLPKTHSIAIETTGGNSSGGNGKTSPRLITTNGTTVSTGNFAMSKGTLMGELGPELVVSNGHYFVAGQNGAEMVDLADDAIVFNHLQTEQLLKHGMSSGRGRAVTSERNAVAFAQGNIDGGPAMASASAALNALKQLRAMWESLLGASVSDLGKGGGGGGGGSKVIDPKAWIDTVERWYNLMQEIARLEQQITHEEKLRAKLQSDFQKNGKAYYTSQKLSLDSLEQQIQAQEQLNLSREDYLDRRVAALKENSFGKIYQFDPETNQLEFRKDTNLNGFTNAMEFLTDLYGFNEQGKANYTNKQKYEILQANGFGEQMLYKDGMEIKADSDNSGDISDEEWESFYEQATEAFRDRMDEYAQATQSLRDEIQKGKDQLLELQTQVNEILQDMRDNQMDVENKVLDAIVDLREREIDALQDERDKLEESVNKYVDGLSNALDKEQQMYQNQESQNDLDKQRRRLAILQRSGGSASDIANLQNDINQSERDMYFDLQQQQIDAIQEASQLELERMDTQIEIMNETLEFQKEYGLLWEEVYNIMGGSAAQITDFISGNSEFWSQSPLATSTKVNEIFFGAEQWTSYREDAGKWNKVRDALFNQIKAADKQLYNTSMIQEFGENYDPTGKYAQIFEQSYNEHGDVTRASTAARSAYTADKLAAEEAERKRKEEDERKRREQEAAATAAAAQAAPVVQASGGDGGDKIIEGPRWVSDGSKGCHQEVTWKKQGKLKGPTQPHNMVNGKCSRNCGYRNQNEYVLPKKGSTPTIDVNKAKNWLASGKNVLSKFDDGGMVDRDQIALVHAKEAVLTPEQTHILRENILSNKPNSLISLLSAYNQAYKDNRIPTLTNNSESMVIENATVNMNVQQLANDYDAKRAGEQALAEIMRIARKTSANNSIRR